MCFIFEVLCWAGSAISSRCATPAPGVRHEISIITPRWWAHSCSTCHLGWTLARLLFLLFSTYTHSHMRPVCQQFISVFGLPRFMKSDQGSNFSSHLLAQVLKHLKVHHNKSSTCHAQSQGALERFHHLLKFLLRSYCVALDQDWEDGLPWLLLAAHEVVQSIGFSPNQLVFGHTVRGPLTLLHDAVVLVIFGKGEC